MQAQAWSHFYTRDSLSGLGCTLLVTSLAAGLNALSKYRSNQSSQQTWIWSTVALIPRDCPIRIKAIDSACCEVLRLEALLIEQFHRLSLMSSTPEAPAGSDQRGNTTTGPSSQPIDAATGLNAAIAAAPTDVGSQLATSASAIQQMVEQAIGSHLGHLVATIRNQVVSGLTAGVLHPGTSTHAIATSANGASTMPGPSHGQASQSAGIRITGYPSSTAAIQPAQAGPIITPLQAVSQPAQALATMPVQPAPMHNIAAPAEDVDMIHEEGQVGQINYNLSPEVLEQLDRTMAAARNARQTAVHARSALNNSAHIIERSNNDISNAVAEADVAMGQAFQAASDLQVNRSTPSTMNHRTENPSHTHSSIKVPLPPIPMWDGKDPHRRAETFLSDIERYAHLGSQDEMEYLYSHLQPTTREALNLVRNKAVATNQPWNWLICKQHFIRLSGDMYKQLQQQALLNIIDGNIKQKQGQSVAEFRLEFDNTTLQAGGIMPEIEQAAQFVRGLLPDIRKKCTGDAQGHLFQTMDTAFEFAQNIERQQQLEKPKTATVAVVSQGGKRHRGNGGNDGNKRGRGSHNRGGRGRFSSGRGFGRGRRFDEYESGPYAEDWYDERPSESRHPNPPDQRRSNQSDSRQSNQPEQRQSSQADRQRSLQSEQRRSAEEHQHHYIPPGSTGPVFHTGPRH